MFGRYRSRLHERVERFERRYYRVDSMRELMQLRVIPEPPYVEKGLDGQDRIKEGSVVVVLDESHRWMNARGWTEDGRKELLEFFALARKRGFVIFLISQRAQNIDVQVRELYEDRICLSNLRNTARFLGMRVVPFNIFIAGWFNTMDPKNPMKFERYRLNWMKRLYDTMDTSSFSEGDTSPDRIWLPRPDVLPTPEPALAGPALQTPAGETEPPVVSFPPPDPSL